MSRRMRDDSRSSFIATMGWLFADMLLVLAIIFIAANTFIFPKPPRAPLAKATSTATSIPTQSPTDTPTPTPPANSLILEPKKVTLILTGIDPDTLRQGTQDAINSLEGKIRTQISQMNLQSRRAGIEIAYGGADSLNADQVNRATDVSVEVYKILDMLGQQSFVFCHTVHYDPLFTTLHPHDTVIIDVYFFSPSIGGC